MDDQLSNLAAFDKPISCVFMLKFWMTFRGCSEMRVVFNKVIRKVRKNVRRKLFCTSLYQQTPHTSYLSACQLAACIPASLSNTVINLSVVHSDENVISFAGVINQQWWNITSICQSVVWSGENCNTNLLCGPCGHLNNILKV